MPQQHVDVAVIGLGAMGAAALASLAMRGVRAVGFDQFVAGHDRGSSHGESRIFRIAYYEHPDYVPLLQRALHAWRELERITNQTLLHPCGGLWLGHPDSPLIGDTANAARLHGLAFDVIDDPQAIRAHLPGIAPRTDHVAFFEPNAGALLPERSIRAMLDLATSHGAAVRANTPVTTWSCTNTGVDIETADGTLHAERAIVTAGPWTQRVLGECGVQLTVTRQPVAWFEVNDPAAWSPARAPCWAVERDEHAFHYGFPLVEGGNLMKMSIHARGEAADPDTVDRTVRAGEINSFKQFLDQSFPGMFGEARKTSVCMYTNSPDGHFVLDRHPKHDRITIGCGFSGHGFKFAPIIGEALADLALDGESALPIAFLNTARLANPSQQA